MNKTFFCEIDGFRTEVIDFNPEAEHRSCMLCLHGFGGNARTFRRVAPLLTPYFRVWSVSLPWHGKTDGDGKVLNLESYADALGTLIHRHGFENLYILNHSFGARIGAMMAIQFSGFVRSLYLIAPGGYYPPEDLMFRFLGSFPMRRLILRNWPLFPFVKFLIPQLPEAKKAQTYKALRHIAWSFPEISLKARGELSRLKTFKGKTVVMAGENDRLLKASYANVIAGYYADSAVEIIPKAGHLPMAEKPQEVADIVLRYR